MSLINCPECEQTISSDARKCPHCGLPIKKEEIVIEEVPETPARNYGWGTFIYLIIFLAGIVMLFEGKLTGLILLGIGIVLLIGRYKLWSDTGKKIK